MSALMARLVRLLRSSCKPSIEPKTLQLNINNDCEEARRTRGAQNDHNNKTKAGVFAYVLFKFVAQGGPARQNQPKVEKLVDAIQNPVYLAYARACL